MLTHFDPYGAADMSGFCLDPYADPEQEKLLWRQRSKDHDGSAKPLESSSGKVRKALFPGQRKPGRTLLFSRFVQCNDVFPVWQFLLNRDGFALDLNLAALRYRLLHVFEQFLLFYPKMIRGELQPAGVYIRTDSR